MDCLTRKKRLFFCLTVCLLLSVLSGCSPSAKNEREITEDLQGNPAFISQSVQIGSCEIIKRQTDPKNKSDIVYVTAYIDEDELKCTLSYVMYYSLYNEGWLLETVERNETGPWLISGLTKDQVSKEIQEKDTFLKEHIDMKITDCEMGNLYSDSDDWYEQCVNVSVIAETEGSDIEGTEIVRYCANYKMWYNIENTDWINTACLLSESNCGPKYMPSTEKLNGIGTSLSERLQYDYCTYSHMEGELESNKITIYYYAGKTYKFGTQIDLIAVPAWLSINHLADDRTMAFWNYDPENIKTEFKTVDWNIEGTWTSGGSYDDSRTTWDVWLSIQNVQDSTNKRGVFTADVSCDATLIYYDMGESHICKCKTDGYSTVKIESRGEGKFAFTILDAESTSFWENDFDIYLIPNRAGWEGVIWSHNAMLLTHQNE